MQISTQHTSTASGSGRIIAKGAGKQRTIPWQHADSIDRNHGNAAGTLALALGLPWNENIVHGYDEVRKAHTFTWPK